MRSSVGMTLRLAFLSIALAPTWVGAVCNFKAPSLLWNYEGTIGTDHRIRMTLVFDGGPVSGVYFYADEFKDRRLAGAVNGKQIRLEELDSSGRIVGGFEGAFVERDPSGKALADCYGISGNWHGADTPPAQSFNVLRTDNSEGTLAHRYALAGVEDDEVVNQSALKLWRAVMDDDRKAVAALVAYPVKARVPGSTEFRNAILSKSPEGFSTLNTPEDFLAVYDKVFSPRYRAALALSRPHNMCANKSGVYLSVASGTGGSGAFLMFNAEGKVTAFFNI